MTPEQQCESWFSIATGYAPTRMVNGEERIENGEMGIGKVKRDLPERTFECARRMVKLCQVMDQTPGVNRIMANQLMRSGTSIGANV